MEWGPNQLIADMGFIVTNSRLPRAKVVKVYNGRGDVENRIKEGKTPFAGTRPAVTASGPIPLNICLWLQADSRKPKFSVLSFLKTHRK